MREGDPKIFHGDARGNEVQSAGPGSGKGGLAG